ncbi:SufS family cysteine desulfurase [Thalassotalea maritima]|uniref:SufS family cysteine desulfurase n=1 Tax=Thalassotalea maritima TaxID=3242416 RepID=UPI003527D1F7
MSHFSVEQFRKRFPLFDESNPNRNVVYFDNAATTQKFASVIEAMDQFYKQYNANVHRGSHRLSSIATERYEQARERVRSFINAKYQQEIIWTKGTTEALNLLAATIGEQRVSTGDDIVISAAEHHANLVCWQQLAKRKKANLVVLPLSSNGTIDVEQGRRLITSRCKILAIAHVSNVVGKYNDISALIGLARGVGANVIIDGAQSIAHFNIDVQALDCDFFVFSGHKVYAPTGIGVLYGKKALLEAMPAYHYGGEMIKHVSFEETIINDLPHKYEAGTPNIAGVIGLDAAISELSSQSSLASWENDLLNYAYQQLITIPKVKLLFQGCPDIGLFSFTVDGLHHQDVASYLDSHHIAVRAGHHCAMPLLASLGLQGSVRMSLAPYNTKAEVDYVISHLRQCIIEMTNGDTSQNVKISQNSTLPTSQNHAVKQQVSIADEIQQISAPQQVDALNTLPSAEQVIAQFETCKGWDQRHRQIMLLSKQLPRLDKSARNDDLLISGCESKAWLQQEQHDGKYYYRGDSDARLIRGLMVVIFSLFQGKPVAQVSTDDVSSYFQQLGLLQHLSPSRGNGVRAIVDRIFSLQQGG